MGTREIKEKFIRDFWKWYSKYHEERYRKEGKELTPCYKFHQRNMKFKDYAWDWVALFVKKNYVLKGKKETFTRTLTLCTDSEFHGIDCIEDGERYGFEGCYNDDLNHPDPRPAHRIWLKKVHAEKLFKLFNEGTNGN